MGSDPSRQLEGLSPEDLAAEQATDLPEREALSVVDPAIFSVMPILPAHHAAGLERTSQSNV